MPTKKFWVYGFCLHVSFVLVIALSAYVEILPTHHKAIPYSDFWGHMILIGMLAFFLDGVFEFRPLLPGKAEWLRLGPVIILTIAAVEEAAQMLSPNRTASLKDFVADVLGIFICSWLAKWLAARTFRAREV